MTSLCALCSCIARWRAPLAIVGAPKVIPVREVSTGANSVDSFVGFWAVRTGHVDRPNFAPPCSPQPFRPLFISGAGIARLSCPDIDATSCLR